MSASPTLFMVQFGNSEMKCHFLLNLTYPCSLIDLDLRA
uniref:Uncharacterized protein n=1 Tax=Rhizophora mucronata TaxID=61149 RepID=A0A2P2Q769_RHIMU